MVKRLEIRVHGWVQGVGFRFCAYQKFDELGLSGSASNESDGTVKLLAQGEDFRLEELLKWCHVGPAGARVNSVDVADIPVEAEEKPKS
jgi:acylphosphatase